ncbi:hypothetical protein B0H13DRAFT_2364278 [Mycena leptocephala]|nr:hypothetical protein B0H13DRAFT_2364278 [Mycena leptocephala]
MLFVVLIHVDIGWHFVPIDLQDRSLGTPINAPAVPRHIKGEKSAKKDAPSESSSLKRVLSRRPQKDRRRRNSLVLPEVPMPDEPAEPVVPFRRGSACTIRDSPPPIESRTVRFILPLQIRAPD